MEMAAKTAGLVRPLCIRRPIKIVVDRSAIRTLDRGAINNNHHSIGLIKHKIQRSLLDVQND